MAVIFSLSITNGLGWSGAVGDIVETRRLSINALAVFPPVRVGVLVGLSRGCGTKSHRGVVLEETKMQLALERHHSCGISGHRMIVEKISIGETDEVEPDWGVHSGKAAIRSLRHAGE